MKFKANNIFTLMGSVFLGVGLLLSVISGVTLSNHITFKKENPSVNAVIQDIQTVRTTRNGKNSTSKHVYVNYEVGENEYRNELGYYISGMHEGDIVKIYYREADPYDIESDTYIGEIITVSVGIVFAGLGTAFLAVSSLQKKRRKNLMENGIRTEAVVTDVLVDRTTKVNNRHPVYLTCQITNEVTGITTTYNSESTFSDLTPFIGQKVTVYADASNPENAYVDIKELVENQIGAESYARLEYK